ncbi:MAG: c-type cytochrome biogenesis protein CcmI [Bacillota bacterium]
MIFAALAALMTFAAAAAVAVPLWRGVGARAQASNSAAEFSHREQLAELERDLASGVLAEADYRAARRDMEAEWSKTMPPMKNHPQRSPALAVAAALMLLLSASGLYWKYGNWMVGAEGVEAASVPAVEHMVEELSQRLHGADQGDLQGWEMLGHAYVIMERYPEALDAYDHARKLSADGNADVLAGYAEAVTLANPDDFMGKALPLFEKVLVLDPRNAQALWYGGLGAFERGDKQTAVRRWQALLAENPPEEYRRVISKYVAEAGGAPVAVSATSPVSTAALVRVHVTLAPALQAKTGADETLFVFAEPEGGAAGPPLAAKRLRAGDLPLDVELTDQDAMVQGKSLADYTSLVVTARISAKGTPTPQPGDLEGRGIWKKAGGKVLAIVIDTPVK